MESSTDVINLMRQQNLLEMLRLSLFTKKARTLLDHQALNFIESHSSDEEKSSEENFDRERLVNELERKLWRGVFDSQVLRVEKLQKQEKASPDATVMRRALRSRIYSTD